MSKNISHSYQYLVVLGASSGDHTGERFQSEPTSRKRFLIVSLFRSRLIAVQQRRSPMHSYGKEASIET